MFVREYRVRGAKQLSALEIEEAVYPFLGPGRTADDVEQARGALEKAFKDKGYQTVAVQIPAQEPRGGVVVLQVVENKVGRLRVRGSRYFSLSKIKEQARSVAEGKVVNFNEVTTDILALNQLSDRRITPAIKPGVEPGTVDIDLNVSDNFPLHGSIELNNRYSADTSPLRLNGAISYNNLWQLGHSLGLSFQVAPEDTDEVKVFSGYYIARLPELSWLSFILQGTKQDSDVSTVGGIAVAGRGEILGARALLTLPGREGFFHSLNLGIDYKHFNQDVTITGETILTPITYYPASLVYNGTWVGKGAVTDFNAGLTLHFRGLGSQSEEFENNRFAADGSFIYFRGSLAHSRDLPQGFQVYGKAQGQLSSQPLVSSEQYTGGGLGTVRGYLESEVLGDNGIFGSLELRSPSLNQWLGKKVNEWRFYAFADAGEVTLKDPLPEQDSHFALASVGIGSRFRVFDRFNGSFDLGVPLIGQSQTDASKVRVTFRAWADF